MFWTGSSIVKVNQLSRPKLVFPILSLHPLEPLRKFSVNGGLTAFDQVVHSSDKIQVVLATDKESGMGRLAQWIIYSKAAKSVLAEF